MKKFIKILFIVVVLLGARNIAQAEDAVTVNLTIRDGGTVVFSGIVPLAPEGTVSLTDADGTPHEIDANSVLAVVHDADVSSEDFTISNLTYFSSFESLYLKCITDGSRESCDNWQYVVDNSYPFVGMDQNILSGGESVYLYFGPQNRITLSSNAIKTSDTLTVTTEAYDYQNDGWTARTGITVGLTQPNPDDPFSPTEVTANAVDGNGIANFSSIAEGTYNVGVKEDYYFPTEPLTVTATILTPPPVHHSSGGGSGSKNKNTGIVLGVTTKTEFDVDKGFDFLFAEQKETGTFGEDIYTDWASMAIASSPLYKDETIKLIKYFGESSQSGTLLTDYERHAMALMALGLNPYNTSGINYINNIVSKFDGKQFGDIVEDNDDIFALIVLQNAGYKIDEKMIATDITFVLNKQKENGSWDESIDMTGASLQALAYFSVAEEAHSNEALVGKVKDALDKAKEFLKKSQKEDGGWGNVSSTAWAIGGILSLSEKPEDWTANGKGNTPLDYLAVNQDTDGGTKGLSTGEEEINLKNRIWETSYALTALSGKTWIEIMQKFDKPKTGTLQVAQTPKAPKKIIAKTTNQKKNTGESQILASQNVATAIVPVLDENTETLPVKKRSWFGRLFQNIGNIFSNSD